MGGQARVRLESETVSAAELTRLAARARAVIDEVATTLTRFDPASELCRLNRDPRAALPTSALLVKLVRAAIWAHERSDGLVDATLLGELEACGYEGSFSETSRAPLDAALAVAPPRRPALPRRALEVTVDARGWVRRAPGIRIDSGGLAKGMAADLAAAQLPEGVRYAIACGGDLAVGGGAPWGVAVAGADGAEAYRLAVPAGGVATSGISGRIWEREDGTFAHHLLDPGRGTPAWTGLVAATAVAGTTLEAEVLAKTALLSGPRRARRLLRGRGGVLQHDDGRVEMVPPRAMIALPLQGAAA